MPTQKEIETAITAGNRFRERIAREKTRTSFGWFDDYDSRFQMFNTILDEYLVHNVSGGSLHVYIEDGNKGIDNVQFCRNYAFEEKDWVGVYLCEELLYYGEKFINTLVDEDVHLAFAEWVQEKRASND